MKRPYSKGSWVTVAFLPLSVLALVGGVMLGRVIGEVTTPAPTVATPTAVPSVPSTGSSAATGQPGQSKAPDAGAVPPYGNSLHPRPNDDAITYPCAAEITTRCVPVMGGRG